MEHSDHTASDLNLFGLKFSGASIEQLADIIATPLPCPTLRLVATTNVDHVVNLMKNPLLRRAYRFASIRTIDGAPVAAFAYMRGHRDAKRVPGSDLTEALLRKIRPEHHRIFVIASNEESAGRIRQLLIELGFHDRQIATSVPPLGFHTDEILTEQLCEEIRNHRPTHLFMGLGSPKTETWIYSNRHALPPCYVLAVGSAVDFAVGFKRRAPEALRRLGLEWAWRVGCEPRRLTKRYFIDAWLFLPALMLDLWSRGRLISWIDAQDRRPARQVRTRLGERSSFGVGR